jgi:hypothetical protein
MRLKSVLPIIAAAILAAASGLVSQAEQIIGIAAHSKEEMFLFSPEITRV